MKKMYIKPVVEQSQLMPATIVLAGSPQGINNGGDTSSSGIGGGSPIGD